MLIELEQAAERLESPDNIVNRLDIQPIPKGGNPYGRHGRPFEEKVNAGALAHIKTSREVAEETGYSARQVRSLKIASPDQSTIDKELASAIDQKLDQCRDKALDRLMESLGLLNDEKMEKCNAKDLSAVAANMSKVASNSSRAGVAGNQFNVVIYAPRQKELKEFDCVDV